MTRTATDPRKAQAPRLNRDDWLDAAYEVVAESGFDAVRVLSIADTLKVTRGSFYWHFIDHADLIAALLQRWQVREIEVDKRLQADATDDPQADLVRLLDIALAYGGSDLKALSTKASKHGDAVRGKAKLKDAIERTKKLLGLPAGYRLGIVPASDTGAVEMALWSLLGARPVTTIIAWESFGEGWVSDIVKELKLKGLVKPDE